MLVDGRRGRNRGAILEHPLFDQLRSEGKLLPKDLRLVRVPGEVLDAERSEIEAPLATPSTKENGSTKRLWLAARSPVQRRLELSRKSEGSKRTSPGHWVFALEDAEPV